MALTRISNQSLTSVTALPAAISTGKVLQVVNGVSTTRQSSSSTTYADVSGLSVSITPSSSSNKVLVMVDVNMISNASGSGSQVKLLRDSTVVTKTTTSGGNFDVDAFNSGGGKVGTGPERQKTSATLCFLDSPSSTSALTYKIQFRTSNSSNAAYVNGWALNSDQAAVSSITVMEIAA